MLLDFKGRAALVTGAGSGIGRATALLLAESGAHVAVNDVKAEAVENVVKEVSAKGANSIRLVADVSSVDQVEKMVSKVLRGFGRIDVLVNNAGVGFPYAGFEVHALSDENWKKMIDIHLNGTFNCTRAVTRAMVKQRSGAIVNVSSINAKGTMIKGIANYAAAKAGIIGFTIASSLDLAPHGIRINAVAPGFVATPMTNYLSSKEKKETCKQIPLGRFAKPEEIAAGICFLASDAASYITGSVLDINGGRIEYVLGLVKK